MCISEDEIRDAGWIFYKQFSEGDVYCDIYLSPKTIAGKPSIPPD
jgi:hypothetical protein